MTPNEETAECSFSRMAEEMTGASIYPKETVTVSGPNGTVLAAPRLPFPGRWIGGTPGPESDAYCEAAININVPVHNLYTVDAFGMKTDTGASPLLFEFKRNE
jgi:hypothetical protein